jgi:5-methylthioribose kinase
MADDDGIASELGQTFDAAAMGYLKRAGASADDWAKAQEIERHTSDKIQSLQEAYQKEQSERVAKTKQQLIEKAAQRRLDHPAPSWFGASTSERNDDNAKRLVQLAHEADLARVREETRRELSVLVEQALNRSQAPSVVRDAFTRASDGSSGEKPGGPKQSHG